MDATILTDILEQELVLAMGCTEPAACALAGAEAARLLGCEAETIEVETTRDMLKNAMGVSIPGFSQKGVGAAVALGVAGGDASLGLDILSRVSEAQKKRAQRYRVAVRMVDVGVPLYVKVLVAGGGHTAVAAIGGSHTHVCRKEKDGTVLLEEKLDGQVRDARKHAEDEVLKRLSLQDIVAYAQAMPPRIERLLLDAMETNMRIARESLSRQYGLGVGKALMENDLHDPPESYKEALEVGAALAAGGSDARMAGCLMPVVINSGSGNQGLTITVPIKVVGEYLGKSPREIATALCIAELVGLVLTAVKGRLSAQCGAFTASIGTACGLAWLNGGDCAVLERVVNNMVGDLAGVICDGAKKTCALKIHSCLQSAYLACGLALKGEAPSSECGIIGDDARKTLGYLSRLTHDGMEPTDRTILSIMLSKTE